MSERKLRVGIIGVGWWGGVEHVPQFRKTGRAEVVAICRRDPALLEVCRQWLGVHQAFTDWREMLDTCELDAVVVSTTQDAHLEPTLEALEHGLHVLVEKPLATTVADAEAIARGANQSDRIVSVGYNNRSAPYYRAVRQLLQEGTIGRVRQVQVNTTLSMRRAVDPDSMEQVVRGMAARQQMPEEIMRVAAAWRSSPPDMGHSVFADTATHAIDAALGLAGAPPVAVSAFMEPALLPDGIVASHARLANGVLLSVNYSLINGGGATRWSIQGDDGTVSVDLHLGPKVEIRYKTGAKVEQVEELPAGSNPTADFVAAVLDGAPVPCTPQEAVWAVQFVEAANRSASLGQTIWLDR